MNIDTLRALIRHHERLAESVPYMNERRRHAMFADAAKQLLDEVEGLRSRVRELAIESLTSVRPESVA